MSHPDDPATKLRAALKGSLELHLAEMSAAIDRKAALDEVCTRIMHQITLHDVVTGEARDPAALAMISEQLAAAAAELVDCLDVR